MSFVRRQPGPLAGGAGEGPPDVPPHALARPVAARPTRRSSAATSSSRWTGASRRPGRSSTRCAPPLPARPWTSTASRSFSASRAASRSSRTSAEMPAHAPAAAPPPLGDAFPSAAPVRAPGRGPRRPRLRRRRRRPSARAGLRAPAPSPAAPAPSLIAAGPGGDPFAGLDDLSLGWPSDRSARRSRPLRAASAPPVDARSLPDSGAARGARVPAGSAPPRPARAGRRRAHHAVPQAGRRGVRARQRAGSDRPLEPRLPDRPLERGGVAPDRLGARGAGRGGAQDRHAPLGGRAVLRGRRPRRARATSSSTSSRCPRTTRRRAAT